MYSESCTQLRYKGFDRDVKINFTFLHTRFNAQKEHEACMCECCPVWPLQLKNGDKEDGNHHVEYELDMHALQVRQKH